MRRTIIVILTVAFCSCVQKSPLEKFQYSEDLNIYFKNTFGEEISNMEIDHLFIVPLSSCTPCVQATLKFYLENRNTRTGIIMCGLPDNQSTLDMVLKLEGFEKVWNDNKSNISKYRTNIGAPFYLSLKNGIIKKGLELDNKKINDLKPIFD